MGQEPRGEMATEYLNFEEVLRELQVDENELKQLVSDGDLRGFRDADSMKFKREDVLKVKKGRETEPTIILTDSDQAMGTEETSDELILEDQEEPSVLNIDDIVAEEVGGEDEITLADEEEAVVPTVEVPALEDEDEDDIEAPPLDLEEEEDAEDVAPKSTSASRIQRSARLRAMQLQEQSSHITWTLCLLVTAIFLIPGVAVYLNMIKGVQPIWITDVTGFFQSLGEGIYQMFG